MSLDRWHTTHELWHVEQGEGQILSQNFSFLTLTVWEWQYLEDISKKERKKVRHDMWYGTCDMWQVICDRWWTPQICIPMKDNTFLCVFVRYFHEVHLDLSITSQLQKSLHSGSGNCSFSRDHLNILLVYPKLRIW